MSGTCARPRMASVSPGRSSGFLELASEIGDALAEDPVATEHLTEFFGFPWCVRSARSRRAEG